MYVPVPCIFELGNRIAGVPDGEKRKGLAGALFNAVRTSLRSSSPWTIIPYTQAFNLDWIVRAFSKTYVLQGIGLTDTNIIREAERLKEKYGSMGQVHIWTMDKKMKAHEPDTEKNSFLG